MFHMTDKAREYMLEIFGENYTEENAKNISTFLRIIANGTVRLIMDADAKGSPYYTPMCSYQRMIEIADEFYGIEEVIETPEVEVIPSDVE